MKQSKKVALCGVMTALSVVIMLAAYFPYLTFALPALAGAVFCVVMIEIGTKWAFGGFVTAAILSVLFCEKESSMMFTCFFGFYPILKSYYEKIRSRAVEYIVKFATFTACVALDVYKRQLPSMRQGDKAADGGSDGGADTLSSRKNQDSDNGAHRPRTKGRARKGT